MVIVHVFIHVHEDSIHAFSDACRQNAQSSVKEPGIARFDVIRQDDDPCRFVLVEVYRSEADTVQHKETQHYKRWRDAVQDMMAEPRYSIRYTNVFPDDSAW